MAPMNTSSDWLAFLSYVGGLFIGACALLGAYVVLRWGFAGVRHLWRQREYIDSIVREDYETERRRT